MPPSEFGPAPAPAARNAPRPPAAAPGAGAPPGTERTGRIDLPCTGSAPDFAAATQALDAALAAMPLGGLAATSGELKREYAALVLYVLHTRERLALLEQRCAEAAAETDDRGSGSGRAPSGRPSGAPS